MVDGPSSPGARPSVSAASSTASMISGAEEPSAMSVRLATVGFQTSTLMVRSLPSRPGRRTTFSADVICSIASMKMSEMMATPKKHHASASP